MAYRQTYGRQSHRNGYAATATGLADKLNNIHNQNKVNIMEHIKTIALLVVIFALYAVVSNDDYNTTVLVNQAHMEAE